MGSAPTLETARLVLRPWSEADCPQLAQILSDPQVTEWLFGDEPLAEPAIVAKEACARRIATWEVDGLGFWALVLKSTGEVIGWAGLQYAHAHPDLGRAVEIGWMIGRKWWGNGYAPEAAEVSLRYGFEDRGLERVYAFTMPENVRSKRVMEKLGMAEGGQTVDVRDGEVSDLRFLTREAWRQRTAPEGDERALTLE